MFDVTRGRRAPATWLLRALPVAALLLSACEPEGEGGYSKVPWRSGEPVPEALYPDPPEVIPGTTVGAAAAGPIVAANLPAGVTQAMVDEGQQLFGTICSSCHGAGGTGTAVAPELNDPEWLNITGDFESIVAVIANGVPVPQQYPGPMPPQGGGNFTPEQIRSLAAYVYALSHQEDA